MRNDLCLSPWHITCHGKEWADEFFESIFFIGNGRMGIRGYLSGEPEKRPIQKGLYLAGIFGEIKPGITDFVNLPTPVWDEIRIDGERAQLVSEIRRTLDIKAATLTMEYTLQACKKSLSVVYRRFLPKSNPALIMQRLSLIPSADMRIQISSGILLDSCNSPIPDDQTKNNSETIQLAQCTDTTFSKDGVFCHYGILGTELTVTQQVKMQSDSFRCVGSKGAALLYEANAAADIPLRLDKISATLTSRDVDPRIAPIPDKWNYDQILSDHRADWEVEWQHCDLNIPALRDDMQTGLRYSMYQLMGSCNAKDPTVSMGARGLSHGRYKGCYFWDTDLFMLPFFLKNNLEAAKNLCSYRVLSLPAAKKHSESMNTAGARYPWMAALDGSEQCETWDIGCSELHITADVAFALDAYCRASNDAAFYLEHAAEVFIETARFWVSRYTYRPDTGEADLLFCKGPDEYCGITNNNLFTNVMVQHNLALAVKAAKDLQEKHPELYQKLNLSQAELDHMETLREAIKWPRDPHTGHLRQDETLHLLEDVDISKVKLDAGASYHHVCFDRLQRYKVIKQADVLLIMTRLPQLFTDKEKEQAWLDFEPLCLHDSTLSFASHALFALQNGFTKQGYAYLEKALLLDLRDVMGNTGHEGLHLACMGEAWQAAYAVVSALSNGIESIKAVNRA